MSTLFRKALLASALGCAALSSHATIGTVYDFNDLPGVNGYFNSVYQGFFTFGTGSAATTDWFWVSGPAQFPQNPGAGGSTAVYTENCPVNVTGPCGVRESQGIVGATPFFLNSFYISGDQNVTVNLYTLPTDTVPAFSQNIALSPLSPAVTVTTTFTPPPTFTSAIQKITFTGFQGYFAVDDINVTAVPEPATYAMLLGGLALVGAAARRQRKA